MDSKQHPILLFDGVCNLCNGFVQFIIKRDPKGIFRFTALQSEAGQQLLDAYQQEKSNLSTVILIDNGQVYTHSDVALKVANRLGGAWSLLGIFAIIPRPIRDRIYNWVAQNRYRWFGEKEQCMIPTPDIKARFLD